MGVCICDINAVMKKLHNIMVASEDYILHIHGEKQHLSGALNTFVCTQKH